MRNLILFIFGFLLFYGCAQEEYDIPSDSFASPRFFLEGTKDGAPFGFFAGQEDINIFANRLFYQVSDNAPSNLLGAVGEFTTFQICSNICVEFIITITAPTIETSLNIDDVFSIGSYDFDYQENGTDIANPSAVRIHYTTLFGEEFKSINHINPSTHQFKITAISTVDREEIFGLTNEVQNVAQLSVEFDVDLVNDDNEIIELRNMKGVIIAGNFD